MLHRLYAWMFGYFWLPCPVCGRMFGGHEIAHRFTAALLGEDGRSCIVCPDPQCSHDAAILNRERGKVQFIRSRNNEDLIIKSIELESGGRMVWFPIGNNCFEVKSKIMDLKATNLTGKVSWCVGFNENKLLSVVLIMIAGWNAFVVGFIFGNWLIR